MRGKEEGKEEKKDMRMTQYMLQINNSHGNSMFQKNTAQFPWKN